MGDARGYFFKEYEKDTGLPPGPVPEPTNLISVAEGDIIIAETREEYEVTRLIRSSEWGYTVFEAILRRRTV